MRRAPKRFELGRALSFRVHTVPVEAVSWAHHAVYPPLPGSLWSSDVTVEFMSALGAAFALAFSCCFFQPFVPLCKGKVPKLGF
jgi:hypothetical protein